MSVTFYVVYHLIIEIVKVVEDFSTIHPSVRMRKYRTEAYFTQQKFFSSIVQTFAYQSATFKFLDGRFKKTGNE